MAADVVAPQRRTTSENIATLKESLSEVAEAERERVRDALELGRAKARAQFDETVTRNPIRSLAIAAGVGVLLGLLLGRRR
jgi:ElaB/YqjD/DUF883 family membrane-anchored ribosome-binding protein